MNLRHISKTSLKSSSFKYKEQFLDEKSILHSEVQFLRENVEYLSKCLENHDVTIKVLSTEKDKLHLELKSLQLTNRNLKQQLEDEREIHFKEKEYLLQEINKTKNPVYTNKDLMLLGTYKDKKPEDNNFEIVQQLKNKDEVIFNICRKYMKISNAKKSLQNRINVLQYQTQKMCENIMSLLQENQDTLDKLVNKLLVCCKLTPQRKKYLKDIKSYGQLHYENMKLKISVLSFKVLGQTRNKDCKLPYPVYLASTNNTDYSKSEGTFQNQCHILRTIYKELKIDNRKNAKKIFQSKSDTFLNQIF